jgi:glycosyltransferase involved in cell wall biosynthesis
MTKNLTDKRKLAFFTPKMSPEAGQSLGVQKKVQGQIRAFQRLGFQVELFDFAPFHYEANILRALVRAHEYTRKQYRNCFEQLLRYRPDAIYIRYNFSDSHLIHFLKSCKMTLGSEIPIYVELATFPYDQELRSSGRPGLILLYLTDLSFRGRLHKYIDRVVTFSDYQVIFGIPTIKISNGVDTQVIQTAVAEPEPVNRDGYHFIGVSNLVFWTGYERMIKGLSEYNRHRSGKKVVFHIVGDGLNLEMLQNLVAQEKLEDSVVFHGAHSGDALDQLFIGSDLAIGNLGVHRKGMTINPDLKNREYCARGIPLVTSTIDPGFPRDFPYLLTVPPDESPIEIKTVVDFLENLRLHHPGHVKEIRAFAEEHFDWAVMLKPVAEKIWQIRQGRTG